MPIQMHLNGQPPRREWVPYDDDQTLELLITPLTPPVDEKCQEAAMTIPPLLGGSRRRQQQVRYSQTAYQRAVFLACVQGWRFTDPEHPALIDEHGAGVPYSEEHKAKIADQHIGLVTFGADIAIQFSVTSIEQVMREREAFRGAREIPPGVSHTEL